MVESGATTSIDWGGLVAAGSVLALAIANHIKGSRKDKSSKESREAEQQARTIQQLEAERKQDDRFRRLTTQLDQRFDTIEANVRDVRHFCVGVDGENGFRGDIRKINQRLEDFDRRDRERLEQKVGIIDRRASA